MPEGAEKFIKAINEMIGLTTGLAEISSRGVRPFLTQADTMFLERGLGSVFGGGSDPEKFVKSAEAFKERITPVQEFLKQRRHGIHHLIRSGDYGRA